jgi:Fe2+ transport system protein FeoA
MTQTLQWKHEDRHHHRTGRPQRHANEAMTDVNDTATSPNRDNQPEETAVPSLEQPSQPAKTSNGRGRRRRNGGGPLGHAEAAQAALIDTEVGRTVEVTGIDAGKNMELRLKGMGISVGSCLSIIQRRSGGIVIAREGSRWVIGRGMAGKIQVRPCSP